jgi:hypothetical protein
LLLAVGGVAALSSLTIPTRVQGSILRVAAPLALCLVMSSVHGIRWNPANQCGLAIFAAYSKGRVPLDMFMLWAVVATLVSQLTPPSRLRVPAFMAFFFAFNCMTVSHGMSYTRGRAHRAAHSLEAAAWIHENLPPSTRIGYDTAISRKGAPHGLKRMYNVYRAMMFATYPRPVTTVSSPARLRECDYFYTMAAAENPLALPLSWTNGDYTLYKVVPEAFESAPSGAGR